MSNDINEIYMKYKKFLNIHKLKKNFSFKSSDDKYSVLVII